MRTMMGFKVEGVFAKLCVNVTDGPFVRVKHEVSKQITHKVPNTR